MAETFQARVDPWLIACFGETIARDKTERAHRFLEEALELVQAAGCTAHEARQLVDYTFARPAGETSQEVGGVMTTLAAFCLAHKLDMHEAGETELARIWTKVETIRAKQAAKPKHSPLPEHVAAPAAPMTEAKEAPVPAPGEIGRLVESICHKEQLQVWSHDIAVRLALGDYLRHKLTYDDRIHIYREVEVEIRSIVESVLVHPGMRVALAAREREVAKAAFTAGWRIPARTMPVSEACEAYLQNLSPGTSAGEAREAEDSWQVDRLTPEECSQIVALRTPSTGA